MKNFRTVRNTLFYIILILLILFSFMLIMCGIQRIVVLNNLEKADIIEYCGTFDATTIWHGRRRSRNGYKLENGDTVILSMEYIAQENSSEELCFRYLAEEDFLYRSHIVLSVTSIDQNSIYLSQESSKESWLKFSIVTIITGCLLFVLTSMIPVIFLVAPKIKSI